MHPLLLGLVLSTTPSTPALPQPVHPADTTLAASTPKTPLPAKTLIDQAVKTAKAEHKTVFVHVGASWCGWCHRLDAMLHSAEVGPIFTTHYVIVPLTGKEGEGKKALENPGIDSVMDALQLGKDLPTFAFIGADGKEISSSLVMPPDNHSIGFPGTPEEIQAFGDLLKKSAPRMTDAERTKITDYVAKSYAETQKGRN